MTRFPNPEAVTGKDDGTFERTGAAAAANNRRQPLLIPCAECEGLGRWHGVETINPSEQPAWHVCWTCEGRGEVTAPEPEMIECPVCLGWAEDETGKPCCPYCDGQGMVQDKDYDT